MLELMHDRTRHGNKSMLVECVKSKLVTELNISEKHIRYFRLSDHYVCDVCARSLCVFAKNGAKSFLEFVIETENIATVFLISRLE